MPTLQLLKAKIPFINFFDGFRTSHEIQKVEAWDYEDLKDTTSNIDKTMEPILYEIGPNGESGRSFYTHNGEEFIFIIEGKLDVYIDETVYSLNEGDSLYFKSSQKHRFKNTTDKLTRAIWVVNPPTF